MAVEQQVIVFFSISIVAGILHIKLLKETHANGMAI
jgi:hypothetical protein